MTVRGTCFCGSVRYEIDKPLRNARCCHCSRCRRAFSGPSSAYAEVEPGSLRWLAGESQLTTYTNQAGWGLQFCRTCGSTLCGVFKGQVHGVSLGCVDGDPGVAISMHIFVGSKAPWHTIGGDAPQFQEFPT